MKTIQETIQAYLETIKLSRSEKTFLAYKNALNNFQITLSDNHFDVDSDPISNLHEDAISLFAADLKSYSTSTEQMYITAVKGFFEFIVAEELSDINLAKIKLLIRQRIRKPGKRLPQFPSEHIQRIIISLSEQNFHEIQDKIEKLRALRDRAFIITLADTGLRVHEACALKRGDIDWNEGKAIIIGKGNIQAVIRFSRRSQEVIKDYLQERAILDGNSGKPLSALPLFSRHDKGAGKKVKPITPTTGRNIVADVVKDILGSDASGTITPHSFRHFFVTRVLSATGNLKLAQNLARHKNIAVTQRYAHLSNDELDEGYWQVFEE